MPQIAVLPRLLCKNANIKHHRAAFVLSCKDPTTALQITTGRAKLHFSAFAPAAVTAPLVQGPSMNAASLTVSEGTDLAGLIKLACIQDSNFRASVAARWADLRSGPFAPAAVTMLLDGMETTIHAAALRDYWMYLPVAQNPYDLEDNGGGPGEEQFADAVVELKVCNIDSYLSGLTCIRGS